MQELRQCCVGQDVIGITESWATSEVSDAELKIDGFNLYREDRKGMKGGGLLLYIS